MSAIVTTQKKTIEVEKITHKELQPGDEFWIVLERESLTSKIQEVWQFQVLEILPGIAKVNVIFPRTGHEEVAYFERAAIGGWLKVYTGPEETGYFLDNNIVEIVIL